MLGPIIGFVVFVWLIGSLFGIFGSGSNDTVVKSGRIAWGGKYKTASGRCFRCNGTGRVNGSTCHKCGGSGRYVHTTWYR